jgi:O-antigen/teichoic acid export membrane protein
VLRTLVKHGSTLTLGNLVSGLLGYAFMIVAARGLGPADFGAFGALLSLFYVALAPIGAVNTLVAQNLVELRRDQPDADITPLIRASMLTVILYSLGGLALYCAASPFIARALKIDSPSPVLLLGILCVVYAIAAVFRGALQGLMRFTALAVVGIAEAALRLLFLLGLAVVGLSLTGSLSTYLVAASATLVAAALILPIHWPAALPGMPRRDELRPTPHAHRTMFAFCVLAALSQLDMLAAKHFLPADAAGHYAAACSLIRNPFLMIVAGFAGAMFPSVVEARARTSAALRLLGTTALLSAVCLGAGVAVCYLFPRPVVAAALGDGYLPLAGWLGTFALASCVPAALTVAVLYSVAVQSRVLVPVLLAGLVAETAALLVSHGTAQNIMEAMVLGNGVSLAGVGLYSLGRPQGWLRRSS